ncbi:sensor domain-containing diguanylate cyclase [Oleisolibacter albus]|uniref:sensor domain-containing diguanylate cyclase n=1 Tax=Oleisolibacter albus TaxID=2171757 RepID=UPI000DF3D5BF|nr:sensor domain-containing diguanylate cyclase [Oleisolibacter albus]
MPADAEIFAAATPLTATPAGPDRSVDLRALMQNWPGPALLLTIDGTPADQNGRADALAAITPGWADDLCRWVAAGGPQVDPVRSLPVQTDHGPGVVEFTITPLRAGDGLLLLCLGRDATLERRLRQALTESRQRYKDLVDISSDFAWEVGPDGRFIFVSPAGAIGYSADELVGRDPVELVLPEFADQPLPFQTRDPIERVEVWLRAKDGSDACLISSAVPLPGPCGRWQGARGACRNITEARLKGMELARARLREQYLGYIISSTRDDVDPARTLEIAAGVAVNATGAEGGRLFARLADGYREAAGTGALPPAVAERVPELMQRLDTQPLTSLSDEGGLSLLAARTLFQQEVNGVILVWRTQPFGSEDGGMVQAIADHVGVVVAQARYQERLKTLSERDELTGLLNRRAFLEALDHRLLRKSGGSALLYFDLDNFKAVNDSQGHGAGDAVLQAVGSLLTRLARPGDMAGRLGGDEFVLWVDRVTEAQALSVADRLLREAAALLRPLSAAPELPLGVSVGVAVHQGGAGAEPSQRLVDRADQAMYAAKRQGKGHCALAPAAEAGAPA